MLLFTEKSEAVAQCKEMPVVPGNKVADEKKKLAKRGAKRRRGTRGSRPIKQWCCVILT
jgi:hypothetical protein